MLIGIVYATAAAVLHPLCTLVTSRYSKCDARKPVVRFVINREKKAGTDIGLTFTNFIRVHFRPLFVHWEARRFTFAHMAHCRLILPCC